MTLKEFNYIVAKKERELIGQGIDPKQLSLLIARQLINEYGYSMTENTRFKGFYGLYKIEIDEANEMLEPRFIIEEVQ